MSNDFGSFSPSLSPADFGGMHPAMKVSDKVEHVKAPELGVGTLYAIAENGLSCHVVWDEDPTAGPEFFWINRIRLA